MVYAFSNNLVECPNAPLAPAPGLPAVPGSGWAWFDLEGNVLPIQPVAPPSPAPGLGYEYSAVGGWVYVGGVN